MPQFDAFPHPVPSLRRSFPLALNLRSDLIAAGEEALIAPLVPRKRLPGSVGRLSPVVEIDAEEYVVLVEYMTTVPARELPRRVANLARYRDELLGAVDLLFYGV
jgi:toxin CcdB